MRLVGHTRPGRPCICLGHTTSNLSGQQDSWKSKQIYKWIWIFMIKCTLKSIYKINIEFFLTEWKTAYKEEELCYLFEKKSKVSDIQTIGKGININSVYTSFLILDTNLFNTEPSLILRKIYVLKPVSPEKNSYVLRRTCNFLKSRVHCTSFKK